MSPPFLGFLIGLAILAIGGRGLYLRRIEERYEAEDADAITEWEMHTAIALDDD